MSSDVSKLSVKQLEDRLQITEKTLMNKVMLEKLPDKGQKLLDSLTKISNELKFRRDMEKTMENMNDLMLAPKESTPETYSLKLAEAIDKCLSSSTVKPQKSNSIIKLTCVESIQLIENKMAAEKENIISFPMNLDANPRFVNFREDQDDSDDDDDDCNSSDEGESEGDEDVE